MFSGGEIAIWTNTFEDLDKYIRQFRQIHLTIGINTFYNYNYNYVWDNYILQFGQIHLTGHKTRYNQMFLNIREGGPCRIKKNRLSPIDKV